MKKYILIPLVAVAAFTGCQDFLVEDPVLEQSNELTLSTYEGLDKAVEFLKPIIMYDPKPTTMGWA